MNEVSVGYMYSKFEAQISREVEDRNLVFKIVLLKIKIDDVEHWVFSTFFTALSETGETLSVKTFA